MLEGAIKTMRKNYLDNIRWFTVLLVVFYHIFYMYDSNGVAGGPGPFYENQPWDIVEYILYPWFMILLYIVSGVASRHYLENHTEKEFLKSRTTKVLVPSTIGVLVLGWIQGIVNLNISGAYEALSEAPKIVPVLVTFAAGSGVLWYLHLLWIYCLILYFIRKFEKGKFYELTAKLPLMGIVAVGVLLWASAQVLNVPVIVCYRVGVYGMAFFLGYFVFAHQEIIDRLSRYWLILLAATIALFVFYAITYFGENYASIDAFCGPISIAYAWSMCLLLLAVFNKFFDATNGFTKLMNGTSFGLYVFHYFGISLSAFLMYNYTHLPVLLIYIITGAGGYLAGFGIGAVIRRIPFLRWCMLGIKERKK